MKKHILILVFALILSLALTACSSTETIEPTNTDAAPTLPLNTAPAATEAPAVTAPAASAPAGTPANE